MPRSKLFAAVLVLPVLFACQTKGPSGDPGPAGTPGAPGSNGSDGSPGQSVTSVTLDTGDSHCPNGGVALTSASGTSYLCNGGPGSMGSTGESVTSTSLDAGDADCPNGGTRFDSVSGTTFACNGSDATVDPNSFIANGTVAQNANFHLIGNGTIEGALTVSNQSSGVKITPTGIGATAFGQDLALSPGSAGGLIALNGRARLFPGVLFFGDPAQNGDEISFSRRDVNTDRSELHLVLGDGSLGGGLNDTFVVETKSGAGVLSVDTVPPHVTVNGDLNVFNGDVALGRLEVDDARLTYVPNVFDCQTGNWCNFAAGNGGNRFSSGQRSTNCAGDVDCSGNSVELNLTNNTARTVLMAHNDGPSSGAFSVFVSYDGGQTWLFQKTVDTWRSSNVATSRIITLVSNLPVFPGPSNIRVRVVAVHGRLAIEGFALSNLVEPDSEPAARVRSVSCPVSSAIQDCACGPHEVVVSGGGFGNQGSFLRESRPLNATTWRISCSSTSGVDVPCAGMNLLCRTGP